MKKYLVLLMVASACNQFIYSQCSGKALQFDGVNDYVIVPDNPSINFTTQFTAELWIKTTTTANTVVIEKSNNNTNYGFQTYNGNVLFFISSISTPSYIQSSIAINDNNWHHLAGTFDDAVNTLKLYIDGVLNITNTNATNSIVANNQPLLIGSRSGVAQFPGQLDELRLWNTVLSGTTIQQWKNKTVTASHPNYANLAAYLKFDEGAGFTTSDASVNGNTGTLTNGPLWVSSQAPVCGPPQSITCAGNAIQFDGVNDYIETNNASLTASPDGTMEAWVNTSSLGGDQALISRSKTTGTIGIWLVIRSNGMIDLNQNDNSFVWHTASSTTLLTVGQWNHVAATWGSGGMKLYINGVLEGSDTYTGVGTPASYTTVFGDWKEQTSGAFSFRGKMDEVRIWNTTLSQTNIQQWKNKSLTSLHPNYANLAGYWGFNEGVDLVTADASGNNNHGVLTNGPVWVSPGAISNDIIAPVPTVSSLPTITGQCSATVTAPTATDNCAGTITATTTDLTSYNAQGTYTVHWTYNDGNGNTSTQNQTVIVDDDIAPVMNVANLPTVTGQCSASVSAPIATDNCAGTITGSTTDLLNYTSQGTYTVHWTYNDGNGNTSTQNQTVIVDDDIAPVMNVANLPTVTGQCSATVTAPTATDNCAGTITATTTDPTSYNEQGTYTVHWTYDDGNGNISTQNQTVIVDDDIAPVMNVANLPTVTGQCSASVSAPIATDNCAGTITATTTDLTSYSTEGTYTVHWTYDDGNGNISTQNQNVIVDDDIAPVPNVANLPTVTGQCSASVSAPTATDNCAGTITATTTNPTSYNEQGTYTVHWTYDDGNGNTSTQNQTVIVDDITAPNFTSCPANISLSACVSTTTWIEPTASDNCPGVTVVRTAGPPMGSSFSNGTSTSITYTATDAVGNQTTCSFTVTRAATLSTSSSATAILCNGGSSTVTVNATGGTAPYTGTGTFTRSAGANSFTVTDANGCTATTSVTITQPEALVATCSSNNYVLYFGYTGDQTATITVKPSGGVGPYRVSITMNRPLKCNIITSSGDEVWIPGANTGSSSNISCPISGSSLFNPVSTSSNTINSTTGYSVNVTLMQDAIITATVTDANGCTSTCTISIHAEDVRCFAGNSGISKVTLCHQTGSTKNPCVTICVDESAVAEHIAHGDFMGKCTPNCVAPIVNTESIAMNIIAEVAQSPDGLGVKIWPVPTENFFTLQAQSASNAEIIVRVIDISGKQLYINKGPASKSYRFGETFVAGMYIVEVRQGSRISVTKVIKQ